MHRSPCSPCPPRGATARRARSDDRMAGRAGSHPARSPPADRRASRRPLTTRPSPSRSMPWWWWDLVACSVSPAARAASVPSSRRTSWSAPSNEPITRRCSPWPKCSGRCWRSVPPRATLISCIPRQIPSTGSSRSIARVHERDLERVALGHRVDRLGVRLLAVERGIDVGAAGEHEPVDQIQHLLWVLDQLRSRAAASAPAPRRAAPRRRSCAPAASPADPRRSSAPARARCTCRSRDDPSATE